MWVAYGTETYNVCKFLSLLLLWRHKLGRDPVVCSYLHFGMGHGFPLLSALALLRRLRRMSLF